jgi:hypothetical protein
MKASIAQRLAAIKQRRQEPAVIAPRGTERHYTPEQVAELWGVHPDTVRRLFAGRDDVLKLGTGESSRRRYTILRIPESTLHRVHAEYSGGGEV